MTALAGVACSHRLVQEVEEEKLLVDLVKHRRALRKRQVGKCLLHLDCAEYWKW